MNLSDKDRLKAYLNAEIWPAILLSVLVLAAGLFITHVLWKGAKQSADQALQADFELQFVEATQAISERMNAYTQVLRAAQGLFNASDTLKRGEFRVFHESLKLADHYPGIQGLGFSLIIKPEDKYRHIEAICAQGFTDYAITPAGVRDLYTSIIYLEPFEGRNLRAFGFDMYSEPTRRMAMDRARDTGVAALSQKVLLVQDFATENQSGLLMYLPVYKHGSNPATPEARRRDIIGWVYAVFRTRELIERLARKHQQTLRFNIYDGDASNMQNRLYDGQLNPNARFNIQKSIEIAGRHWRVTAASTPLFEAQANQGAKHVVGKAGVLISALLTLLVGVLAGSRYRAAMLANKITRELRVSEQRMEVAKNAAHIGIWDWDIVRNTINWDDNMYALYGVERGATDPDVESWAVFLHPEDKAGAIAILEDTLAGSGTFSTEFRIVLPDRGIRYIKAEAVAFYGPDGKAVRMTGVNLDITAERMRESRLKEAEARWKHALEGAGDGVWDWQVQEGGVMFSDALISMLGYSRDEMPPNVDEWIKRIHPDDLQQVMMDVEKLLDGSQPRYRNEHRLLCKDGSWKWILDRGAVISRDADGKPLRAIGTHTDISGQKAVELALRESEARFRNSFDTAAIGMALISPEGKWLKVNQSLCAMLGYTEPELLAMTSQEITVAEDLELDSAYVRKLLDGDIDHYQLEKRYLCRGGEIRVTLSSVSVVRDDAGKAVHFVAQIEDVTAKKQEEAMIKRLAFFDVLTDLPNRRLFEERLHQAVAWAQRNRIMFAVMFIDVDYFKNINDQYGHDVGDEVLKVISARIIKCLRNVDTLSRFGGDELVVLLSEINRPEDALIVAENIRRTVSEPFTLDQHPFTIGLSIGIAVHAPDGGDDEISLMKKADMALYQVKASGRGNSRIYL